MPKQKNVESDETHDVVTKWDDRRADEFVSKVGQGQDHCHMWVNKDKEPGDPGRSGVEHRGFCKVCDDVAKEEQSQRDKDDESTSDSSSNSGGK